MITGGLLVLLALAGVWLGVSFYVWRFEVMRPGTMVPWLLWVWAAPPFAQVLTGKAALSAVPTLGKHIAPGRVVTIGGQDYLVVRRQNGRFGWWVVPLWWRAILAAAVAALQEGMARLLFWGVWVVLWLDNRAWRWRHRKDKRRAGARLYP